MTPVGRAMERGAKKSAQYLLQIGKFPCPISALIRMDFLSPSHALSRNSFAQSVIGVSGSKLSSASGEKGWIKVAGHWPSSLWRAYRQKRS